MDIDLALSRLRILSPGAALATAEVAAVMQLSATKARAALARVARPVPAGADFYWALDALTEYTGGRWAAAENQVAPASAEPYTSPEVAPK